MCYSQEIVAARRYIESQGLYLMQKKDISRFVECAVESYGNISYPLFSYFMGRDCTKEELKSIWNLNIKYFLDKGLIYSDSPECNGWILWLEPGFKGVSALQFIRHGGLRMTASIGIVSLMRIMAYEDHSKKVRMDATGGSEWYLYNLVVAPNAQGKHISTKLVFPMLEYSRSQGRPAFLETHLKKNISIYKHFGFQTANDAPIPGTTLRHIGMVKP